MSFCLEETISMASSTGKRVQKASQVIRELERVTPYMVEGLYGNFLRRFMDCERSRWTKDLSIYLGNFDTDCKEFGNEVAEILWERFEKRISC
jgi:hypothetical protein